MGVEAIDACVHQSLDSFARFVVDRRWLGRENEAVNLFALGHFLHHASASALISDPTQLGIEVAVPQFKQGKAQARKDLVVWPRPGMTCFDDDWKPTQFPLAVLEWKWHRGKGSPESLVNFPYDLDWLRAFTDGHPERVGYAIAGLTARGGLALTVSRVHHAEATTQWYKFRHGF